MRQAIAYQKFTFRELVSAPIFLLQSSVISAHSAMEQIESAQWEIPENYSKILAWNSNLRRGFCILTKTYPTLSHNMRLRLTVKALNDTAGSRGLVPSLLVFGTITSLGNTESNLTDQQERIKAMYRAWNEAGSIIAEQRIRTSLQANIPTSEKYQFWSWQTVMACSEKQKR